MRYGAPHELVISVILSAQCTDEQVNRTTPALFERFVRPEDYVAASLTEIEELIYSTGFYRNKARNIQGFCRALIEDHGGKTPETLEELVRMPGIGRKTANVVLGELYGKAPGLTVDTHVARISRLWSLSKARDAVHIERDLLQLLKPAWRLCWPLYVIFLGRSHCTARRRDCQVCYLGDVCPASSREARPVAARPPGKKKQGARRRADR